jgi:hypothetical protein
MGVDHQISQPKQFFFLFSSSFAMIPKYRKSRAFAKEIDEKTFRSL